MTMMLGVVQQDACDRSTKENNPDIDTISPLLGDHHSNFHLEELNNKDAEQDTNSDEDNLKPRRVSTVSCSGHKYTVINYGQISEDCAIDIETHPVSPHAPSSATLREGVDGKLSTANVIYTNGEAKANLDDILESLAIEREPSVGVTSHHVRIKEQVDVESVKVFHSHSDSSTDVARRGRIFAKRKKARLVLKDGTINVSSKNIKRRGAKYLVDIFTTLLELKWRYNILLFMLVFLASWVIFALAWWILVLIHDAASTPTENDTVICVEGVFDFRTALLFSIETQHTIGYGTRAMTDQCPMAIVLLVLQAVFGVLIQCMATGFILAKFARPKNRRETIVFSKNAVICQRDGALHLILRVGDMRKSHMIGVNIEAILVQKKVTAEGERRPVFQYPLKVTTESESDFFFMAWPILVTHKIDVDSPLWNLSAEQLLKENFEIIVVLEATNESTGMTTQLRTSYLPSEILWGHRLASLVTFQKDNGGYCIDHSSFHRTDPVDMPELSARRLSVKEMNKKRRESVYFF